MLSLRYRGVVSGKQRQVERSQASDVFACQGVYILFSGVLRVTRMHRLCHFTHGYISPTLVLGFRV